MTDYKYPFQRTAADQELLYTIATDYRPDAIRAACQYQSNTGAADVMVELHRDSELRTDFISIEEKGQHSKLTTVITDGGIAKGIEVRVMGSIGTMFEDRPAKPVDETYTFKNTKEFKENQPRLARTVENALAAINGVSSGLEGKKPRLSAAQTEMMRTLNYNYLEHQIAI